MSDPSPELLAANERLLALRERLAGQRAQAAAADQPDAHRPPANKPQGSRQLQDDAPIPGQPDARSPASLPPHLGWDSPAVTSAIRARQEQQPAHAERAAVAGSATASDQAPFDFPSPTTEPDAGTSSCPLLTANASPLPAALRQAESSHFTIHPSLALALLRRQQVAAGRLWLLLRALDEAGRGWLNRTDIEAAFADPDSPSYFCTTRYLRQLLAAGDGLFWQREGSEKVWLRGQAKVAAALGIDRLRGRAVELPFKILFGPIGDLRAHLYASFHSSRGEEAGPISRAALRELSGVSPRTQQSYDARAEVEVQPCLALGSLATASNTQSHAWQHGRAAFTFTDHQGKQGAAGSSYQAHRLPNRYIGPHPKITGRPKRLNRQLIDLCHKGYAGNDQPAGSPPAWWRPNESRRYYPDGATAGRVWLRQQGRVLVYWQANNRMAHNCMPNNHMANNRMGNGRIVNNRRPAVCFWYMLGTGAV
jgi:hypothetical protein